MSQKLIEKTAGHDLSYRKMKVLVYETNPLLGKGLAHYLSYRMGMGLSLQVVTNAEACVQALEEKPHFFIAGHSEEAIRLIAGKSQGTFVIFHTSPEDVASLLRHYAHKMLCDHIYEEVHLN
jgi:hypothetical protein